MKRIVIIAALIASVCACSKVSDNTTSKFVVTVGIEDGKTSLSPVVDGFRKVLWSVGDKIAINGVSSDALTSENLSDGNAKASFVFSAPLSTPYNIVFPASIYTDADTVSLPAVQEDGGGDNVGQSSVPMYGYSGSGNMLYMRQLCSILSLKVKKSTDPDNIKFVEFRGLGDEQVKGPFIINYETGALTGTSTAPANKYVRVAASRVLSTSEASVINIVVPSGVYSSGFKVRIVDVNGHFMDKKKTESVELLRAKIYNMSAVEFVPTGTIMDVEIQ